LIGVGFGIDIVANIEYRMCLKVEANETSVINFGIAFDRMDPPMIAVRGIESHVEKD
jgi:hypothetical protein